MTSPLFGSQDNIHHFRFPSLLLVTTILSLIVDIHPYFWTVPRNLLRVPSDINTFIFRLPYFWSLWIFSDSLLFFRVEQKSSQRVVRTMNPYNFPSTHTRQKSNHLFYSFIFESLMVESFLHITFCFVPSECTTFLLHTKSPRFLPRPRVYLDLNLCWRRKTIDTLEQDNWIRGTWTQEGTFYVIYLWRSFPITLFISCLVLWWLTDHFQSSGGPWDVTVRRTPLGDRDLLSEGSRD